MGSITSKPLAVRLSHEDTSRADIEGTGSD